MDKIRRINIFAGPGCGKSVTSATIFAELKKKCYTIEYVSEYIKLWTYIPRVPKSFDSYYCQSKQLNREDTILRGETDLIVSDSPLMLASFYAWHHEVPGLQPMIDVANEIEKLYPSINIFLIREDQDYDEIGRYENRQCHKTTG